MNSQVDDDIDLGSIRDIADFWRPVVRLILKRIGGACDRAPQLSKLMFHSATAPNGNITLMLCRGTRFIKEISEDFRSLFQILKICFQTLAVARLRFNAVHAQAYCINPGRGVDRSFFGVL